MSASELNKAISTHNADDFEELLHEKADVNAADDNGDLPLTIAARFGHVDMIADLLDHGAAINAYNEKGNRPLTVALIFNRVAAVNLLLERGADPHIRNQDGKNAFDWVASMQKPELTEIFAAFAEKEAAEKDRQRKEAIHQASRARYVTLKKPS